VNRFGVNSEYSALTSVLLYAPGAEIGAYPDPARILHLRPVDHPAIMREYADVIAVFEAYGTVVTLIEPTPLDADSLYRYNMMYCRDLFFMTPLGAIMANMANSVRGSEPLYAARSLKASGVPLLHTVYGEGRFEGADALWLRDDLVLVGVGNRTNVEGYRQVCEVLSSQNVECLSVPSTQMTTQHLLGSVQIVDHDLALVRHHIIDPEIVSLLEKQHFMVVRIPENREVREQQAMNIVTIAPRTLFMTAGCPDTKELYLQAGLTIATELELSQLINGAGGLACATGIVARERVPYNGAAVNPENGNLI
jgi:N-dimethylarginine dimethylaminohydrolase